LGEARPASSLSGFGLTLGNSLRRVLLSTPQEALENVLDAINCWVEAAREMGRAVPRPRRLDT
jgi:RNA polymerase Rpb3/Rpb11 dimerisation domain